MEAVSRVPTAEQAPAQAPSPLITKTATKEEEINYPTGLRFWLIMFSLVLAGLLVALNASMLGTATPSITSTFHSIEDVGWYGSSYLIANCATMPLTGRFFAVFRLKLTFMVFIFIFEIGALISALSTSSNMLIGGRTICGIGGSGIITGATCVIMVIRPMSKRPLLVGILYGFISLGQVTGPLVGGALSEITWRWVFYINLPLGGIVLLLMFFVVKLPVDRMVKSDKTIVQNLLELDYVGFVVFAAANVMVLMALEWGGTEYAWNSSVIIGLLVGGCLAFAFFVGWSIYIKDRALIPTRLFKDRVNVACGLTGFLQSGGTFMLMYFLPIWFQGIKGASSLSSGIMILPTVISQLIASFTCGALVQKTGYYLPEAVIGNAWVAIAAGLFTTFTPSSSEGEWIGYQILAGAGRGFVMQLLSTAIQANVPLKDASQAQSFVMFSQYFGGAIFICVARTVLTSSLGPALNKYAPDVDPTDVINTGVTELKHIFQGQQLAEVLKAYNSALVDVFYVQLAVSASAFVCCWFLGWRDVRQRRKPTDAEKGKPETQDAAMIDNKDIDQAGNDTERTDAEPELEKDNKETNTR